MIAAFIETMHAAHWREVALTHGWRRGWSAFRLTFREIAAEERRNHDVVAISIALSRLSPRQLSLIGVRQETLFCDVEALVWRAGDARGARDEIVAILEGNTSPIALPAPERGDVDSGAPYRADHGDGREAISQAA